MLTTSHGKRNTIRIPIILLLSIATISHSANAVQAQDDYIDVTAWAIIADGADSKTKTLDGSHSFIAGDTAASVICTWEVITETYQWLILENSRTCRSTFTIPSEQQVQLYGASIEFKLTVYMQGKRDIFDDTTIMFHANTRPTAVIRLQATLEDESSTRTGVDRFTANGIIDGPRENGNRDNEWDIVEGSLLVLDASDSFDPDGLVTGYRWTLISVGAQDVQGLGGLKTTGNNEILSTDDPNTDEVETLDTFSLDQSPKYAYYSLMVTDDLGNPVNFKDDDPTQVIKIVIHAQGSVIRANLFATTITDDPTTNVDEVTQARTSLSDDPTQDIDNYGELQQYLIPVSTPRFVVKPGTTVTLDAGGTRNIDGRASYDWSGDVENTVNEARNTLKVGDDAENGTRLAVTVTVTDSDGDQDSASIDFVVVDDNTKPIAESGVPGNSYVTDDGEHGGDLEQGQPTGRTTFHGFGFDPDQPANTLIYSWNEITFDRSKFADPSLPLPGGPIHPDFAVLNLENSLSDTVSFDIPEVSQRTVVNVTFTVVDQHGTGDIELLTIIINPVDSSPIADAGPDQLVKSGDFVRLSGINSADPDVNDRIPADGWSWQLTEITTDPHLTLLPAHVADQARRELEEFLDPRDPNAFSTTMPKNSDTPYPYFTAPQVAQGINYIQIIFTLTVTDQNDDDSDVSDGDADTDVDTVAITVVKTNIVGEELVTYFSGDVTGPDFCINASLGGPRTYTFDGDRDGIADTCVLNTSRRATIAIQHALEMLAVTLNFTIDVPAGDQSDGSDAGTSTHPATFSEIVVGRADSPRISGTCSLVLNDLGDSDAALAKDACAIKPSSLETLPVVDPLKAPRFFSGVITGTYFCANFSLGGPWMYAFDSDNDGVADTCASPFTRREAAARQAGLMRFRAHPQFYRALELACAALGTLDFGDTAVALAWDECAVGMPAPAGMPLPR